MVVPLLDEQGVAVGSVTAAIERDRLRITYAVNAPLTIRTTHLAVATALDRIAQTSARLPIVASFPEQANAPPGAMEVSYDEPITWLPGDRLYIAAQAELGTVADAQPAVAWGAGLRFAPDASPASYFTFAPRFAALPPTTWSGGAEVPLIARNTQVGTVTASIEGDQLLIDYAVTAPGQLIESFLDIETDPASFPQAPGNHQPIVSHFAFHTRHAPGVESFRYQRAIFWAPGQRVFIAATASVATGSTCAFAWGAGTPFTSSPRGHRDDDRADGDDDDHDDDDVDCGPRARSATYFSFTPLGIETHGQGTGWVSTHVGGTLGDTGQTFQADLLMIQSTNGLVDAPLPAPLLADFASDEDFASSEYILDASIVSEIDRSLQLGQLTPALLAIAEPADPLGPISPPRPFGLFGKCSDKAVTFSKSINLGQRIPLKNFDHLPPGFSGSVGIEGNAQGSAEADLHLALKRFKLFGLCIPYLAKFIDLHAFGSATLNFGATLDGLVSFDSSGLKHPLIDLELFNPLLADVPFFVGPIPVIIKLSLPISVGLDLKASLDASITYSSAQTSLGAFDYTCTFSGCNGSASFNQTGAPNTQPITAGVSGHLEPEPWAEVAVRASLYDDRIGYVQLGVRPYLLGDLWGFSGNNCGDANGDGVFEPVRGLTFDLDWQLALNLRAAFFQDPKTHPAKPLELARTQRRHLGFNDLIGSSALQPMLIGPASVAIDTSQTYRGTMRRCWPYDDEVSYTLDWGDGASDPASGTPSTLFALDHTWTSPATRTLALTALRDTHGRNLGGVTTRSVEVTGTTAPPGAVPTTGLHLWLKADAGVTTSNGVNVASWADQSGNGRDATMPQATRQPELVGSALNGLPVIRFGGAQSFVLDTPATPTRFTIFIVGKNTKLSDVSIILGPSGNSPNNQLRWENDTQALFVGTGNGLPVVTATIGNTRVYHAFSTQYDGATMSVYRDGGFVSSAAFSTAGPWIFASVGAFFSSLFMEGDLAEILIYDRPLSTSERESVDSYLRARYGLP